MFWINRCRLVRKCFLTALAIVSLVGCVGLPKDIKPVGGFEIDSYLGTWYEVARLDHRFERGLSNVTAEYGYNADGSIYVTNRGYRKRKGEWTSAQAEAQFVDRDDVGHLKVAFFLSFYSSYVIFELDNNYRYAYVTGHDKDTLWLLSRTPSKLT